jgi:hypothetical protein
MILPACSPSSEVAMPVREYVSPDGKLKFLVTCPDGDWIIGFDGFPRYTHGSILAELSGLDEITAIERFIADLTDNISVIFLRRRSGLLTDAWITDDPATELSDYKKYGGPDETIEFRRWNGTAVEV